MEQWISFKKLKETVSFKQVLDSHGIQLRKRGKQLVGACPLPHHTGSKGKGCFSVNTEKGIFQCFTCGAKGNLLDFAALIAKRNPENGQDLRQTGLELQAKFGKPEIVQPERHEDKRLSQIPENKEKVLINPVLDFELKDLDPAHPYLINRGFTRETMEFFGAGYCNRAWLKGRIAIPLHDSEGKLVGYAGRLTEYDPHNPKYMFPGERERKGFIHKFEKSRFLYNGFRVKAPVHDLIMVEGFPSVWWLHQNGFPNAVACMGDSWSEEQIKLILELLHPKGRAWIITDGDFAGRRGGGILAQQLITKRQTRIVEMPGDKQPTDLSVCEMQEIFS